MRTRPPYVLRFSQGFSLLELSVVLIIISLVTGMAVMSGMGVISTSRISATQKKMAAIDQALLQYRTINGRLPCPSDLTLAPGSANYGLEAGAGSGSAIAAGTGACTGTGMLPQANFTGAGATNTGKTGAEGALPAITLGLPADYMLDGWGNRLRYTVDVSMTASGAFVSVPVGCNGGAITLKDASGNTRSTSSIYALLSHGANGHGAYTKNGTTASVGSANANELINCHCSSTGATTTTSGAQTSNPATYIQADVSANPSNALDSFDDIVSFKERWQMQTLWDKTGTCGYIYVADTGNNRIQKFDMFGNFILQIGCASGTCAASSASGKFANLNKITVDRNGNVWATESGGTNNRVQEFNSSGTYVSGFGCYDGLCGIQTMYAGPITTDSAGNLWLSEASTVKEVSSDGLGTLMKTIPYTNGTANGKAADYWRGIAVDTSGNYWVGDDGNNRVEKFNSNGTWLLSVGGPPPQPSSCTTLPSGSAPACAGGSGNGQFDGAGSGYVPAIGAIDSQNNIWVIDSANSRFQKFNSSGTYQAQFGSYGSGDGQFGWRGVGGMTIDSDGNLWMGDPTACRVQKFNSSGTYLMQFGSCGTGNGQFASDGYSPNSIAYR